MLHALNLGGRINEFRHPIVADDGSVTAPSIRFANSSSGGLYGTSGQVRVAVGGQEELRIGGSSGIVQRALLIGLGNGEVELHGAGTGVLEQRGGTVIGGTNAQTFRLYNTFTDASNYERLSIGWSSNTIVIGTQWAGTGANHNMVLDCLGLLLYLGGSRYYTFNTGGFLSGGPNQDLGDGAGSDWRDLYLTRDFLHLGGNGQRARIKYATELTTIAASPDTDTAIQVPANAIILGVSVRVTVQPGGTSTLDIGISGDTTRYVTGMSSAATTTAVKARVDAYASATSIRITPNTTPSDAAGRVRVTIHYLDLVAPTS